MSALRALTSTMFLFGFHQAGEDRIELRFRSVRGYLQACEKVADVWPEHRQVQLGMGL